MVRKSGFTLVELTVVIAIIGILATLGLTNYQASMQRARDGKRKADLEQIRSALEMYRTDNQTYPVGTLVSGQSIGSYLTIPQDPSSGRQYYYNGSANSYLVCASLEEESGDATGCGSNCGSAACNYKVSNP
jgi:general secretion pathway protein G